MNTNQTLTIIDNGAMEYLSQWLDENYTNSEIFLLTDENVYEKCLPLIDEQIERFLNKEVIVVPPGESSKTIEISTHIWQTLIERQADRNTLLVNIGGGMITDLGGFVASVYKRGIPFINIPTSLLAMVDASSGGKTGINFSGIKNALGTFTYPAATFIDPVFLHTLPRRELYSGYAEVIKHHFIGAKYQINIFAPNFDDGNFLKKIIQESVRFKNQIVEQDFKENGIRRILNFGHTLGHAVEAVFQETQNPVTHGEAVIIGIIAAMFLSRKIFSGIDKTDQQVAAMVDLYAEFLPKIPSNYEEKIIERIFNDKKSKNGQLRFVLLKKIGCPEIHPVTRAALQEAIAYYNKWIP